MEHVSGYISDISKLFQELPVDEINQLVAVLHQARINNNQVFVMGNGGSASTATHFVCDLIKNTRVPNYPDFRVIGLADNMATFSAYGNDEGYDQVFAQQLASLARPGDVVIGISTSGKSPNVLEAMKVARSKNLVTVGLTGSDGGMLADMVQLNIHVPNWRADQTEDVHLIVLHAVTAILREQARLAQPAPSERAPMRQLGYQVVTGNNGHANGAHLKNGSVHTALNVTDPLSELMEQLEQQERPLTECPDLVGNILLHITESLRASSGSFALLDENMRLANAAIIYSGHVSKANMEQMEAFMQSGLAGWAVKNRQPALLQSTNKDRRWLEQVNPGALKSARSVLCVPLIVEEHVAGVITLSRPDTDPFTGKEMLILTGIVAALTSRLTIKHVA